MIEINNISKNIKNTPVLSNIQFSITNGVFGLLGHNGAGKTTLMRILATLLSPSDGDVIINGISLSKHPERIRKEVGYLPQHFHVHPQLTGYELLDFVATMKGMKKKKDRNEMIYYWLEEVNLVDKAKDKVKTYSHGMKQRLGIAQAFIGNPSFLLFDEPTIGLDPEERLRFRRLIAKESKNKPILLSTHVISDVETCCYDVAVLQKGKLLLRSNLNELKEIAQGLVWEVQIAAKSKAVLQDYPIIFSKEDGEILHARVIADEKPAPMANIVSPTIEDCLMLLQGGYYHV